MDRTHILDTQATTRQTELEARKKTIEDELKAIAEKTWKAPFKIHDQKLTISGIKPDGTQQYKRTARFDPALMPKFKAEDDLEQWISEMQIEVDCFGEELVCPLIWRHCFSPNTSVRMWYSLLGGREQAFMTKEEGCWTNFMQKMRDIWAKPLAVAQREAEDRSKLSNESFHQFFFSKLKLLTNTHISRIRAKFNDAQADRYIRERHSITAFGEECREKSLRGSTTEDSKPPLIIPPQPKSVLHHGAKGKTSKRGEENCPYTNSDSDTEYDWSDSSEEGKQKDDTSKGKDNDKCGSLLGVGPNVLNPNTRNDDKCDPSRGTGTIDHLNGKIGNTCKLDQDDKCDLFIETETIDHLSSTANEINGQIPINGEHEERDPTTTNETNDSKQKIFSAVRSKELTKPRRNYLKTSPLSSRGHIGSPHSNAIDILNDVCSNVSLIDVDTFRKNYPNVPIDTSHVLNIHGIGVSSSVGHCRIPVWMEGTKGSEKCLIQILVEVHLVEKFSHQLLLGLDTLVDYGVDLLVTKGIATMSGGEFSYPVSSINTKFRSVFIRVRENVSIFGRTCKCIPITSHILPNTDYLFEPNFFLQQGKPIIPSLSLPYSIINRNTVGMMFQNVSDTPIHLKKGQIIRRATTELTAIGPAGTEIDWCDLVQPGPRRKQFGTKAPGMVSRAFYTTKTSDHPSLEEELNYLANNVLYTEKEINVPSESMTFSADGREIPKARSITEDKLWKKLASAKPRIIGELGNAELEEESLPFGPVLGGKPSDAPEIIHREDVKMGSNLTDAQKDELFNVILEHIKVFGKGDRLGKIKDFTASVTTEGPLPAPQQPRPTGPAK
ncbi:hypothetical protein BGX38DRAFT_1273241 [Terfezia claveryi]|nr:hypothetical protein BGX38DRAFT_1273241 [Terfezia claveryi]